MNDPTKHVRYQDQYKSNDYFWGIGIENETYFQFTKPKQLSVYDIYNNHKPERYSVNYFSGLNPEYKALLRELFPVNDSAIAIAHLTQTDEENNQSYDIPIYMNSHTLQKTDISGNHQTTYEKVPKPNPKFKGKTIHELLEIVNPQVFKAKYKINYVYDGDTIEFMTQNFYKTTVKQNIDELIREKHLFLHELNNAFNKLNLFTELGPLKYPTHNEPFVCFLTNKSNIAIFNNGTYHLNFTMPTQLGSNKTPLNPKLFVAQHKAAIRYIQYLEPFMIAIYGTPDPFSAVSPCYSKASQRCAVSRYIGIGTYNTEEMQTGKILSVDLKDCIASNLPYWWYTTYTNTTHYTPLDKIGVDINFSKHGSHGIEVRFLDWFPEQQLEEIMITMVNLLDYSLKYGCPDDPTTCPVWNGLVVKMLKTGKSAILTESECDLYQKIFRIKKVDKAMSILTMYNLITKKLGKIRGSCSKKMLYDTPGYSGCFFT